MGFYMDLKNVLIVDDDVDLIEINKMSLEKAGFKVFTAANSAEAMKIATANEIATAILDVMMDTPTEGFLLAREMRQNEKTKNIPLLMLTSVNTQNEAIGSFVRFSNRDRDKTWLPVDRFMDKPVGAEELVSAVRTLAGAWTFSR
jgi:CheY-like chemotaxis protein